MRRARTALLWCFSLCLFSVFALVTESNCGSDCLDIRSSTLDSHAQVQDWPRVRRRSLGGPGSYPPRCIGKCGRCSPCRAVHVVVPPGGTPVTTEYYPEAWRCKCGNRLYIP